MIATTLPTSDVPPSAPLPGGDTNRQPDPSDTDLAAKADASPTPVATVTLAQVLQANQPLPPDRENLKVILVGSRNAVTHTIRQLHTLGFAEAGAWSPLLPTANRGQFISILNRYFLKDQSASG